MAADAEQLLHEGEARHMLALDRIGEYEVRPGFYDYEGASPIPGGVNFTVHSHGAVSCELLLYHRKESEPYAVLPFPENYRIGDVYSMIVFGLNVEEFEYAYRVDGPYDPAKGLLFDKAMCCWILMQKRSPDRAPGGKRSATTDTGPGWCAIISTGEL